MGSPFTTPGALSWHELTSNHCEDSITFYGEVFGWEFKTMHLGHGPYHIIENQGVAIGGITPNPCPKQTSHWTGYITVEDVDSVAIKAKSLGGELLYGPEDIPRVGRFCWIKDPQGAIIAAISYLKSAVDDDNKTV
ncbi:VOC family protein [Shewanella canadensis]|uniref:VOC family protein n=1 Tax=Shewanella canadensis TaxID=271096 RepID=A0A431WMY2_9GAMM|nr:VOC family protein [Shewanella canadensis]RTR36569.1 VOC family protein [Shewanella canadensis]